MHEYVRFSMGVNLCALYINANVCIWFPTTLCVFVEMYSLIHKNQYAVV